MTRAERWEKQDQERKSRESNNNVMTAAAVGYFVYKAGEAVGEATTTDLNNTDSYTDD
jgi:hypothetical protein